MKIKNTKTISNWLIFAPLKFALYTFCALSFVTFLYTFIAKLIYSSAVIIQTPMIILCCITSLFCIAITMRKLLRNEIDRASFIAIHNAQTIIGISLFIITSYLITSNIDVIMSKLTATGNQPTFSFIINVTIYTILSFYIFGIFIANLSAKIRRIRDLKIPTWKTILSMPFGFSALWIPGYILNQPQENNSYTIEIPHWYKRINDYIKSHTSRTTIAFVITSLVSTFLFGTSTVLLTYMLALIFGIWTLQIGKERFIKNIGGAYSTTAVIINMILLSLLIYSAHTSLQ